MTTVTITPRQLVCLQHTADGLTEKEIARAMSLSINTVKSYRRHMLARLGCKTAAHAVAVGFRVGLLGGNA